MKKPMIVLGALTMMLMIATGTAVQAQESDETLFVMITTGDAETQMMAMVLATQSANQGADVRILLCGEGGYLAVNGHEAPSFAPAGRTPVQLMAGLMERGATVEVCGIFLPNRELTSDDLLDGVTAAAPPEVATFMRRPDVRLFTF